MQQDYRGHLIRLIEGERWSAELIERATGAILPTKVTASAGEGREACAERARGLIDLYLEPQARAEAAGRNSG